MSVENQEADRAFALGLTHHQAGRLNDAEDLYRKALDLVPTHADALHLYGVLRAQSGDFTLAADLVERALAAQPENADVWCNLGAIYRRAGDLGRATQMLTRAIQLDPNLADAHNNLGNVLHTQHRWHDALGSYQKALELAPTVDSLCNASIVLLYLGQISNAETLTRRAEQLEPNNPLVQACMGSVLSAVGRLPEAVAAYRQCLELDPSNVDARYNLGVTLEQQGDWTGALESYRATLVSDPAYIRAMSATLFMQRRLCEWDGTRELFSQVLDAIDQGRRGITPFSFLAEDSTPAQQLACARLWSADIEGTVGPAVEAAAPSGKGASDRITVGYVSSGFGDQPTSRLAVELFEHHDKMRFRTIAYSTRRHPDSPLKRRVHDAFEEWVDAESLSRQALSQRIIADGVDVLVDMRGYQDQAVSEVFAMRSAPVQVSFLSFPATMGADFMDYIVVDPFVAPTNQQENFAEQFAYLPHCYQPNDTQRRLPDQRPSRAQMGLPDNGFVFCCFNNSYKISPEVFDSWMRILESVDDSVLWLLNMNPAASVTDKLRREAAARGISGDRLIIAERMPHAEYLGCLAVADLFLDTWPYTAHTTASDALWAGCPVLTRAGESFAGRVAGSIVHTVGLSELVVDSAADYETIAVQLARQPERLAGFREGLVKARDSSPLFDMTRYTRDFESALEHMVEHQQAGKPPMGFSVDRDTS